MSFLYVFIGGGLGSLLRYGIGRMVAVWWPAAVFPAATLFSNILSCLLLAVSVVQLEQRFTDQPALRLLLITGFCGGFSTFSAFGFETVSLFRSGHAVYAFVNIALSLFVCLGIFFYFAKK